MSKFYMLVGLPGSGKSTIAQKLNCKVFSSDSLRKELWGNENTQGDNSQLFNELQRRIRETLKKGENCVYDATNINAKRRTSFLSSIKGIECEKICIFVATDFNLCLLRNFQRERHVPYEVIKRMYLNFDIPQFREGWSDIQIKVELDKNTYYDVAWLIEHLCDISHDNPHHTLSIGDHIKEVVKNVGYYSGFMRIENSERYNKLVLAAMHHDIGKEFCKTFQKPNGELDDIAHYYGHENVSAYMFIMYSSDMCVDTHDILYVADLIALHMRLFVREEDREKSYAKLKQLIGEKEFEDLCLLHKADIEGD